jgi:pseudaminic acid synthase|tara:strand:+ start:991 stop:2022 length:1032 start_codon:yes stop_codon:yes gene_type:complete
VIVKINKKISIRGGKKPLIVTEISGNHNGSKKSFLNHIKVAAKNGADMIKIQTYEPKDITIKRFDKKFKIKEGTWKNEVLWNLYKKAHTPFSWHKDAFNLAKKLNITLFSSPFSKRAVDLLEKFKVKLYKIASFEITDLELIQYVARKKKPIIISTGMASLNEIKRAINCIKKYHNKIIILYCVSSYPSKEKDINLNTVKKFKKIFKGFNIGLSDHTNDIYTSLAATTLGVSLIEKHFIVSKKIKTSDEKFSIDTNQLRKLKEGVNKIHLSLGKEKIGLKKIEKSSIKFRRSIFAIRDIKKGERFSKFNIGNFRPKIGIGSEHFSKLIGRKSLKNYKKNSAIF